MNKTHGCSKLPGYGSYKQMVRRCTQKSHKDYPQYGGSGISVHPEWLENPTAFFAEVGPAPDSGFQVDRIDTRLGYQPGNVRWVTSKTNNRNRRNNRFLMYQGNIRSAAEWEEILNLPRCLITKRLNRGWTPSQALGTPTEVGSGRHAHKVNAPYHVMECTYDDMQMLNELIAA